MNTNYSLKMNSWTRNVGILFLIENICFGTFQNNHGEKSTKLQTERIFRPGDLDQKFCYLYTRIA